MQVFQGIQNVYIQVAQLIRSITNWFTNIEWSNMINLWPLSFQPVLTGCIVVILSMCVIGLIKKLSFLLG